MVINMSATSKIFIKENFKIDLINSIKEGYTNFLLNLNDGFEKIINVYITQFIYDEAKGFYPINGSDEAKSYDSQYKLVLQRGNEEYAIDNNMERFKPALPEQSNKYFKYSHLKKIILPSDSFNLKLYYKIIPPQNVSIGKFFINTLITGYSE